MTRRRANWASPGPARRSPRARRPYPGSGHIWLRPDIWQRWLDWDPVRIALRSLRTVWLDAGTRDEWYFDLGAQAFRDQLRAAGLPDERVHFELFDGGHRAIDYRYSLALTWLCHRITDGTP